MLTTLARIIKYGFLGFWRNGWLSTATLSIIVLALIVFEGLIIFNVLTENALDVLQGKIDISIYFKSDTPEDDILKIKRSLESLAEVKSIEYISREDALKIFKERHKEDTTISEAINVLDQNPLSASLNIKAKDPKDIWIIEAAVHRISTDERAINGALEWLKKVNTMSHDIHQKHL